MERTEITEPGGRFVADGPADVAVIVVTYNSAADLPGLLSSLRTEAASLRLRVVVADNASHDDTLEVLRRHDDVVVVPTGGNLGYAGGINVGIAHAGSPRALLILNPDLRVHPGAVGALLHALEQSPRAGVVAPRIVDADGRITTSLFHEPTLARAMTDALLGSVWRRRPAPLTEWERRSERYESPRRVDWASGAALLVAPDVATAVGEWDERYFLYSEETDYCRRVRDAGRTIEFVPDATVEHRQGGSGSSLALDCLLQVSRIRYVRAHAPRSAAAYRRIAVLAARLRGLASARHREIARVLGDESAWDALPHATWSGDGEDPAMTFIVPAHNEEAVIARTLAHLAPACAAGAIDVVVACNACDDSTAQIARGFDGVRVVEIDEASKTAALNAGDAAAHGFPRVYLDADIEFPSAAIPGLARALRRDDTSAARPRFRYDTAGSSALVRAYYRARLRVPAMHRALWGAGVYALDAHGHRRVAPFPPVTADDFYVDERIPAHRKRFPLTPPVVVRVPRSTAALVATLGRARRGPSAQGVDRGRATAIALLRTVRGPLSLWDAAVYTALTVRARRRAKAPARAASGPSTAWERDESSRSGSRSVPERR